MGCWALESTISDCSLSTLLGGTRDRVATGISLGIQENPDTLVSKAHKALGDGYRKIKIKISPGSDVAFVTAARRELGPDAPLMVDANNAYTLDDLELLKELDDLGLVMIEQPLAWDDVLQHAQLQKALSTPVCLDESITSLARAQEMIDHSAGRIINIKPGRVGGFTEAIRVHDLAFENEIPVWCGGMLESGVGRAYNVALASLPNFKIPGDVSPSARYWKRDIVDPEWTMEDGMIGVPQKSGLGVTVNEGMIDDLVVRRELIQ